MYDVINAPEAKNKLPGKPSDGSGAKFAGMFAALLGIATGPVALISAIELHDTVPMQAGLPESAHVPDALYVSVTPKALFRALEIKVVPPVVVIAAAEPLFTVSVGAVPDVTFGTKIIVLP